MQIRRTQGRFQKFPTRLTVPTDKHPPRVSYEQVSKGVVWATHGHVIFQTAL